MTSRVLVVAVILLHGGVLTGCDSAPKDAGFGDVAQQVAQRTGKQIHWNAGAPEDQQAADAVRNLLRDELTIDAAVQIALLNNRRLQATYEDLGVAQAQLVQAGLLRNPVFEASIGFHTSEGGPPDLGFSVAQEFLSLMYMPLRKAVAEAQFEQAKLRVSGEVMDLALQTRGGFVDAQAAQQMLELRRQIVTATEASWYAAQRLHEAGNMTDLDFAQELALHERAKLDLASAELALATTRERLTSLMGLWGKDVAWRIAPRLPDVPADELDLAGIERRAVAVSVDLAEARQSIQVAGKRLGLTKATALIDDLEVGVDAEREDGDWEIGPILALPIPIFDQGQGRVAGDDAQFRRATETYAATAVELRSAARAARQQLLVARDRALYCRDVLVPLQAQITQQSQAHYNAMQIGVFELLAAKQQEIDAGRMYVQSLRDYWMARATMEQLLAGRMVKSSGMDMARDESETMNIRSGGH